MDVEGTILNLLSTSNRPFNVQNVTDMMQKHKIPKSKCDKTLAKLASGENAPVVLKEFGKSKVYYISQEGLPSLTEEEIRSKNAEIEELKAAIEEKRPVVTALKQELEMLRSRKTVEELRAVIDGLKAEDVRLGSELAARQSGDVVAIKKEDVDKVEKEVATNVQLWRKRKRSFGDIWSEVTQEMDGDVKALWEKLGVETDVGDDEIGKVEDAEIVLKGGGGKRSS